MYEVVKKIKVNFVFLEKYLFINHYLFVPFKVIPLRYNILISVLFLMLEAHLTNSFPYSLELFQQNLSLSIHGSLQFWKQEKVPGGQVWWIWGCCWPKNYRQAMTYELAPYRGAITMTWRLETGTHKNLFASQDAALHGVHLIHIHFFDSKSPSTQKHI